MTDIQLTPAEARVDPFDGTVADIRRHLSEIAKLCKLAEYRADAGELGYAWQAVLAIEGWAHHTAKELERMHKEALNRQMVELESRMGERDDENQT